jgi:hypothetical protein
MTYDNNDGPIYSVLNGKDPCIGASCSFSSETGPDETWSNCFGTSGPTFYVVSGGDCLAQAYQKFCKNGGAVISPSNPGTGTIVYADSPTTIGPVNPCSHSECSSLC